MRDLNLEFALRIRNQLWDELYPQVRQSIYPQLQFDVKGPLTEWIIGLVVLPLYSYLREDIR